MTISSTQVQQLTDSASQAIADFTTVYITNTGTGSPQNATIIAGVSGTASTGDLLGRVLYLTDLSSDLLLLTPTNKVASAITAYLTSLRSISGFQQQFFPFMDALDLATSGLNAFLVANSLQVNANFANAFNAYQTLAVSLGYRSSATIPTAIAAANYFPSAAVDNLWTFTASGGTTFSSNAVGTNASTSVSGGGVGQIYIYKSNSSNAIGGATFTITYTNAAGSPATATYTTTAGTPAASGSLASGYAVSGAIGSAITAVTGTGMTSGEAYVLGVKLVRASAY